MQQESVTRWRSVMNRKFMSLNARWLIWNANTSWKLLKPRRNNGAPAVERARGQPWTFIATVIVKRNICKHSNHIQRQTGWTDILKYFCSVLIKQKKKNWVNFWICFISVNQSEIVLDLSRNLNKNKIVEVDASIWVGEMTTLQITYYDFHS